jgi:hypothetical protein
MCLDVILVEHWERTTYYYYVVVDLKHFLLSPATPDPPSVPAVENIGATWARICWDAPTMANSPISRYQIIGREVGGAGIVVENTTTNATFFNITGLLPATTYSFTVVAISEGGDVIATSQESMAMQDTTGFTGMYCSSTDVDWGTQSARLSAPQLMSCIWFICP